MEGGLPYFLVQWNKKDVIRWEIAMSHCGVWVTHLSCSDVQKPGTPALLELDPKPVEIYGSRPMLI